MWDFFSTVRNRHSIRKYQTDMPVEEEKLHAILEMACAAPSAGDLQSYRIIVTEDQNKRDKLCDSANQQTFIKEAPVCLIFCADKGLAEKEFGERGRDLYSIQDTTIAAAYAQLAVVAAGLGSTWVGFFDEDKVRTALDLDPALTPVALLSLGYPAEIPEQSPRQPMDKIIIRD